MNVIIVSPGNLKELRILWMNDTMVTGNISTTVTLNSAFANFANTRAPSAGEIRGEWPDQSPLTSSIGDPGLCC